MFAGDEHLERFINSLLRKVAERRRGGRSGAGSHQELEADLAGPRACPREAGVYVLYSATGPILWERWAQAEADERKSLVLRAEFGVA